MSYGPPDRRGNSYSTGYPTTTVALSGNGTGQTTTEVCRNWNYHECRSPCCRHHHICITYGSNHKAPQCTQGNTARSHPVRSGPHTHVIPDTHYLSSPSILVSRPPSTVSRLPSLVSRLPSPVSRLPSPVSGLPIRANTTLFYTLFTSHSHPMPAGQLKYKRWKKLIKEYPSNSVTEAM